MQAQSDLMNCPDCNGRGEVPQRCLTCLGEGKVECTYCQGQGGTNGHGVSCAYCHGTGRHPCFSCVGSRYLYRPCVICNSTGTLPREQVLRIVARRAESKEEDRRHEEEARNREQEEQRQREEQRRCEEEAGREEEEHRQREEEARRREEEERRREEEQCRSEDASMQQAEAAAQRAREDSRRREERDRRFRAQERRREANRRVRTIFGLALLRVEGVVVLVLAGGLLCWGMMSVFIDASTGHPEPIQGLRDPRSMYATVTSKRKLIASDLFGKTTFELDVMRDELFARHGYRVASSGRRDLASYFRQQPWYKPRFRDLDAVWPRLSRIERYNARFIRDYEQRTGKR